MSFDDATRQIDEIREGLRRRGLDPLILTALGSDDLFANIVGTMQWDVPIPASPLATFLGAAVARPYRDLVEFHLKRESTRQLQVSGLGELQLLPESLRAGASDYIDATNRRFSRDAGFWQLNCFQAATALWIVAATHFRDAQVQACVANPLAAEHHQLAFGLFQIPTLSFAYSASTQRKQREFMGIRKGFFG